MEKEVVIGQLPEDLGLHADLLSSMKRTNIGEALPEGFHEETAILSLNCQNGLTLTIRPRSKHLIPEIKAQKGLYLVKKESYLTVQSLTKDPRESFSFATSSEGFTLNRQQVVMYSINELVLNGYWKMEEDTNHSTQSCPMARRSENCVKRENVKQYLDDTDNRAAMGLLPMESSPHAELLSSNTTVTSGSLPDGFHEQLFDSQIGLESRVEVGNQNDKQLCRSRNAKNALCLMEKEICSPAQIESIKNRDNLIGHVPSQSTIPFYGWSNQMQVPTFQMKSSQDWPTFQRKRSQSEPTQMAYQSIPPHDDGRSSPEYYPDWLQLSKPPASNIVDASRTCPIKNCQCICHERLQNTSPRLSSFQGEPQRPGVIMVPVSRKETPGSLVTHVPLQMKTIGHLNKPSVEQFVRNRMTLDDSDSDKEDRYLRRSTDKLKATFKLSKTDWLKIPIKKFPSGGRLLGGQWTQIFNSKVKRSNPWCSLRFKNNHVRSENSRKMHSAPFFRGAAECKHPECGVKLQFVIKEEKGKYVDVMCIGNVCHKINN